MSDEEYSDDYNTDDGFDFDEIEEPRTIGVEIKPKVSPAIMWDYEKANIIAARTNALAAGSPALLEDTGDLISSYDIASKEFDEGRIRYQLIRYFGKNFEIWKHEDFEYFPK